jgi:hypothetical protein
MNHTGVYGTGSPRQAARKLLVDGSLIVGHGIRRDFRCGVVRESTVTRLGCGA